MTVQEQIAKELTAVAGEMSLILPRLAKLSDERDQLHVKELVERFDRIIGICESVSGKDIGWAKGASVERERLST